MVADSALTAFSIAVAGQLVELGLEDADKVDEAQTEFDGGSQEDDPEDAIDGFGNAWELSQEVVDGKSIWIAEFSDSPDPF